jgi:glyoxylase-like metal-dependent hydrolase (beta-lactamase superfamily II)
MILGDWQLDTINGGTFSIDGGVAFGVVPKPLWSNVITPDANNRVRLGANCLLARNGRHTVLIDAGYGDKYGKLDRNFWELENGNPVVDGLAALSVSPEDVDLVVMTHLHWDHAGGLTRYAAQGTAAQGILVPTFPNARCVIGRDEWDDALGQAPELETAYPLQNLKPLVEAGVVDLIDGNEEIVPGVRARQTGGHTRGHLAYLIESAGQAAFFIGDVCATTLHLHPMWNLSYDTFPLTTRRVKPQLLGEAADGNWWVIWPHDIRTPAARLQRHAKRGFEVVDRRERL